MVRDNFENALWEASFSLKKKKTTSPMQWRTWKRERERETSGRTKKSGSCSFQPKRGIAVNCTESARCRGKEGCYKRPYTTPGLARELGRCHCHGIDICSLLLNFILAIETRKAANSSFAASPRYFSPFLSSPAHVESVWKTTRFVGPLHQVRFTHRRASDALTRGGRRRC